MDAPVPAPPADRTALVAGATGLVGQALVRALLADDARGRVVALARRPQQRLHGRHDPVVVDYDRLPEAGLPVQDADVFCALGTTIRAAGSREAFRRVDVTYVVRLAEVAAAGGARSFSLVSALGAREASWIFYNRVKGEAERRVAESGVPLVHLFRPGLLLGARAEERRGERFARAVLSLVDRGLRGPLATFRPIDADVVAAAMVEAARRAQEPGVRVYGPEAMRRLAGERSA